MQDRHTTIPQAQQERTIQETITRTSLRYLDEVGHNGLANEHLTNLYERLQLDLRLLGQEGAETADIANTAGNARTDYQRTYLDLLGRQRSSLTEMNHQTKYGKELIRKYLALIDLEEYKIREKSGQ